MDPRAEAICCADIAYERKGTDVVILDVDNLLIIASYFVIATGHTRKHLQGMADAITKGLRERGVARLGSEGYQEGIWVLLDFGDVIVQLFTDDAREQYDLEGIWADAPRLDWSPPEAEGAAAKVGDEPAETDTLTA